MITGLAFVAYSVADVARSTAFYRDVVGLHPSEATFGEMWVEFDVGAATFGIGKGEGIGIAPGSQFSAAFEVDDLAAMRERLLGHGVTVTEIAKFPACSSCFATDLDGNRFALHERAKAP